MDVGVPELLIILCVVLLVFGSTRVPKLARSLGEATREFRNAVSSHDAPEARPDVRPDDVPDDVTHERPGDQGTSSGRNS